MSDGRQADIEYRRPVTADRQALTISSFLTAFWENDYHLEVCSFPSPVGDNYLELLALPLRSDPTSPQDMNSITCEEFHARLGGDTREGSVWPNVYNTRRLGNRHSLAAAQMKQDRNSSNTGVGVEETKRQLLLLDHAVSGSWTRDAQTLETGFGRTLPL